MRFTVGAVELFTRERSAVVGQVTAVVAEEVLFPVFGSFVLETVAELRILVEQKDGLFWSCTVIVRVTEEFALSVPMGQLTCCPVIVQPGAERMVSPFGTVSVRETFWAVFAVEVFVSVSV